MGDMRPMERWILVWLYQATQLAVSRSTSADPVQLVRSCSAQTNTRFGRSGSATTCPRGLV